MTKPTTQAEIIEAIRARRLAAKAHLDRQLEESAARWPETVANYERVKGNYPVEDQSVMRPDEAAEAVEFVGHQFRQVPIEWVPALKDDATFPVYLPFWPDEPAIVEDQSVTLAEQPPLTAEEIRCFTHRVDSLVVTAASHKEMYRKLATLRKNGRGGWQTLRAPFWVGEWLVMVLLRPEP